MNDTINKNYIEEMERNSKLFEEKMNKLNSEFNEDNDLLNLDFNKKKFNTKKLPIKNNMKQYNNSKTMTSLSSSNPFKYKKDENNNRKNKILKKRYDIDLNKINNFSAFNNNRNYEDDKNKSLQKIKNYKSIDNRDKKLLEELRENIIEKSDLIKKLSSELKQKEKISSDNRYIENNSSQEKTSKELKSKDMDIKNKEEEIKNLKMKFDSIFAQNKNMKSVLQKKNDELDGLKAVINNMKEDTKSSRNKYNELNLKQKKLQQEYDILNKEYNLLNTEKENLKKMLNDQKANELNLKKEIAELKNVINILNEKLKKATSNKTKIDIQNNENSKNKDINRNNNMPFKKGDYNMEYKNMVNEENNNNDHLYKKNINNNNLNYYNDDIEEKVIYNNNDEDLSDEDEKIKKGNKAKKNSKNKNIKNNFNHKNKNNNNIKSYGINYINRENSGKDLKNKNKKDNEYISLIKHMDKIIGCDKNKIMELINDKDYQTIEKELKILTKEKDKLENELLKMPAQPRKLNDIRYKKEINDNINKIESDINYIRTLLKNTDGYYIN